MPVRRRAGGEGSRCAPGYERICIAHDVCRMRRSLEEAGYGVSRAKKEAIIDEWIAAGLVTEDGDVRRLCEAYERYVACIKRGGNPIWACLRLSGLSG